MATVNRNFVIKNGLEVGTNNLLFVDNTNQRVGIGTTAGSGWTTDIFKNIDAPGNNLRLANASTGVSSYSILNLYAGGTNAFLFTNSPNRSADGGTSTTTLRNDSGDLRLQAMGSVGLHVQQTSGNIGIGTNNPLAKLQISGTDTTDVNYLKVGNLAGPSRYYRYIQIPAKTTNAGVSDTAKSLYVGRLFSGITEITIFSGGNYTEDGVKLIINKPWGVGSVPTIMASFGKTVDDITEQLSYHYQGFDNDSYYLFISYKYNANVPINESNTLRFDITSLSSLGSFTVGTPPTIPTLDSTNKIKYGLVVKENGNIGLGNNEFPSFQFDGFGILRMSSGASYQSQIISRNDANDTTGSYFILEKSRAGGPVQNGDPLGSLLWRGHDSNSTIQNSTAAIYALAEGTIGAGAIPTGMYFTTSTKYVFTGPNGEVVRINGTGNVGIGTTNPSYKTHILADGDTIALETQSNTGRTAVKFITNGNNWEIGARSSLEAIPNSFYIYDNAAAAHRFIIRSDGRVGIGSTNPVSTLDVAGTIVGTTFQSANTTSQSLTNGAIYLPGGSGAIIMDDGGHKRISWNDGAGNFNIRTGCYYDGTSLKYAKAPLDTNGGATSIILNSDQASGTAFIGVAAVGTPGTSASWSNSIYLDATRTYLGSANVGINTDNPNRQLHISAGGECNIVLENMSAGTDLKKSRIYHDTSNDFRISFINDAFTNENYILWAKRGATYNISQTLLNPAGGNVGIGTTNATQILDVNGLAQIKANSATLNLVGTDHTYIQWYPTGIANGRKAYTGYPNTGSNNFTIANEIAGGVGHIVLLPGASGNVGISFAAPAAKLDVGGETSQFPYSIRIRNTAHATSKRAAIAFGNGPSHQILIDTSGNGTEDFSIYQSNINANPFKIEAATGNICIGKPSPQAAPTELAVNGYISESTDGGVTYHNVVTQQDIGFNANQIPLNQYLGQLAFMDEYSPTEIYNPSNTTAQLTIAQTQTSGYAFIQLGKSATATNNFHLGSEGNGYFNVWNGNWGVGAGPRFTISSNGLIGINTSAPTAELTIGPSGTNVALYPNEGAEVHLNPGANGSKKFCFDVYVNSFRFFTRNHPDGASYSEIYRITDTGNVGIGTTNPTTQLMSYRNLDGGQYIETVNESGGTSAFTAHRLRGSGGSVWWWINGSNRTADGGTNTSTIRNDVGSLRLQSQGGGGIFIESLTGNVGINMASPTYKLQVNGSFAATTKSFVIDHPTKPGFKLRYGSLEGPENGVYIRGKLSGNNTIELPEYWTELVDENSITVNLTPIGRNSGVHSVIDIVDNTVVVESTNDIINCFFTVFAERKDVDKLITEYES